LLEPIRLPSGLTLLAEEAPWLQGVSLGLFVRAGVVDEPEGQAGIAHLLEHLVFRGTEAFAGDELSARIDEDGGELNAYTTKEYTCLWGRTLPHGLLSFLEMISELFLRPRLLARDLRRELDVIAEERELWLQSPEEYVCDLLEEEVFAGAPLARSVLGQPDELKAIDQRAVRAFHRQAWRLERAVLAVAGPIDRAELLRAAERLFPPQGPSPAGLGRRRTPGTPAPARAQASQVHVAVGGAARGLGDPGLAVQEMLVQEFGGGPNARLFLRLREELALSYGVYSYDTAYRQGGLWAAYADLPQDALHDGLQAIAEEAQGLRRQRWRPGDVERVRRSARGGFLLSLDAPFARVVREALQQLLLGRRESIEAELGRIEAAEGAQLRAEASQMLEPENWRIIVLHPERGLMRGRFLDILRQGEAK
jgi:predicted Zn-dependent peptidase